MLNPSEHDTMLAIADQSRGYRLPVPIGAPGVGRFTVEALAQYGLVVAEWSNDVDSNIANSMGWCVRMTDLGIDYVRGKMASAGSCPMFGESTGFAIIEGICVESSLLSEATNKKLKKDLKLKTGEVFNKGTSVTVEFLSPSQSNSTRMAHIRVPGRREPVKMAITRLHVYVTGMSKPPTIKALEKMMENGVGITPSGERTEPDGTGSDDSPSWLLVLGYI